MSDFPHQRILLGICGGVAAYKSLYLVRELTRLGAQVRVVMTASAQQFITPMMFQALSGEAVRTSLFDPDAERGMGHIELARWADCFIIAPASANTLAKMAQGIADDLLTTLYLVTDAPTIVCPAMNRSMWAHPATQANKDVLSSRAVMVVGPDEGSQACGEVGVGRMVEPEQIIHALYLTAIPHCLQGKKVLITAGPTQEAIDPVRYLTNRSSGKMGYALAEAAVKAGAEVILVSGPVTLTPPLGVICCSVTSAQEMHEVVMTHLTAGIIFIGAAAVADYAVSSVASEKIKKQAQTTLSLTLTPNPDILALVAASGKAAYVVGFAAETTDVLANAEKKRQAKRLDMIVANQVGPGRGFDVDTNAVTVITKEEITQLPSAHKWQIAAALIKRIAAAVTKA